MAHDQDQDQEPRKFHLPLDPNSYEILGEIGRGCTAIVYKAVCTTTAAVVAVKSVDLDRSSTDDFDNVRREAKTMSLLSHPNILKAHCSFTVGSRLWVVMPFMSAGSLQSIINSSFPDGISESCISIILKETLMGLCYLHDQGHVHRDIKAGNILMDSEGSIKLADFGVSASIYETASRSLTLNEVAGTPYWMAPEVIHSHNGYSYKADIWSFGITALELAHGRPPLSHLPFSKSLVMKITKRFRFSDYQKDEEKSYKNRKFSKQFKDMVGLCLDQDPSKRPCARKLLKHSFFKNCKGSDFLVKNLLHGLPSVEQRFKQHKLQRVGSMSKEVEEEEEEEREGCLIGSGMKKQRRISGWNFNVDGFELDPVFPVGETSPREEDDAVKQVRFVGERMIFEKSGESDVSSVSSPRPVNGKPEIGSGSGSSTTGGEAEIGGGSGGIDKEVVVRSLMALKRSLDDQREKVMNMLSVVGGVEAGGVASTDGGAEISSKEEQLMHVIERLRMELENERRKSSDLEMELEFLKLQISCASDV